MKIEWEGSFHGKDSSLHLSLQKSTPEPLHQMGLLPQSQWKLMTGGHLEDIPSSRTDVVMVTTSLVNPPNITQESLTILCSFVLENALLCSYRPHLSSLTLRIHI